MIDYKKNIVEFLRILSDETRLNMIQLLEVKERTAGEFEELLGKSQSTISQHLAKLVNVGITKFEKKDKLKHYVIGNKDIFSLINRINSIVLDISKEKLKDLRDLDVIDTLS